MATQQEAQDFLQKLNSLYQPPSGFANPDPSQPLAWATFRQRQGYDVPDWVNQVNSSRAALLQSINRGTDDDRARAIAQLQSTLQKNSNAFYSASPQVQTDYGNASGFGEAQKKGLETYTNLSGTSPNQYVNADSGGGPAGSFVPPNTAAAAPSQGAQDQALIESEGQRQYQQSLQSIDDLTNSATAHSKSLFASLLPNIAENSQAAHLYDSSGYGDEVARQEASMVSDLTNNRSQQIALALQNLQGFQTSGLNRNFSLQDYQRQAELSKQLGVLATPQVGNGKGSSVAGLGAGATAGTAIMPGWGTAIGAGLGYLGGGGGGKK